MRYYQLNPDHSVTEIPNGVNLLDKNSNIENRRVAETTIGNYWISTVFLRLDHSWERGGKPILFETMITKNTKFLDYQERCSTWDEAIEMHKVAEEVVRNGGIKKYE